MKLIDLANAPLVKASIAGQIHIAVFHIDELAQVEFKTGKKWHNIDVPPAIKKNLHYLMLIASKKAIAENREGVIRFLEGWIKAQELMGSNKPADKEQFAKIAANASQIDPKVALAAIDSYHAINYWENNNGLDKNQIMAQLNELVQIGSVKPEQKPTYEQDRGHLAVRRGRQAVRHEVKSDMLQRTGSGKRARGEGIARRARRALPDGQCLVDPDRLLRPEHLAADRGVAGARPQLRRAVRAVHRHDAAAVGIARKRPAAGRRSGCRASFISSSSHSISSSA